MDNEFNVLAKIAYIRYLKQKTKNFPNIVQWTMKINEIFISKICVFGMKLTANFRIYDWIESQKFIDMIMILVSKYRPFSAQIRQYSVNFSPFKMSTVLIDRKFVHDFDSHMRGSSLADKTIATCFRASLSFQSCFLEYLWLSIRHFMDEEMNDWFLLNHSKTF